jgi:glycosyltransferase involved in cell wall biosynthesis
MRIALLSAHYPPDFISGGTLQPQRIARGLVAAGHDVVVLAGSLDPERRPLDTWTEHDGAGVELHWIATGPFIGWADPLNYDNPGVTRAAAELFDRWRPDVVHAHALQGLGVGPLDAAADRAIPVVVTMHDFWWICARQFLVDQADRPCPLVVDASDCACQAGREHLATRDRRLRATLERVAEVLVPSEAAAAVLRANGLAPGRLAVDENGVPAPAAARRSTHWDRRAPGDPVVVRYTGGSNPMKGADVLLDAAALLPADLPLRLVGHDLDEALARHAPPEGLAVEAAPPYGPDELDAVLDDTDVLVLPSVMRETFSIVTREALSRGVPAVVTDVLGPEEVVADERNGLVVEAGSAPALATALRRVADDPGAVGRWRADSTRVALRSVDDQVAGLVARFERLRQAGTTSARPEQRWPRRVVFVVGIDGAPLRYRAQLPAEALALLGIASSIHHYRDPGLAERIAGASAVVVYRVPATEQVLDLIDGARAQGIPVAFDVDDLIFDPDLRDEIPALRLLPPEEGALWLEGVRRYRTTLEHCDAFIGSTTGLVDHARTVVGIPAVRFENGVGRLLAQASDRALRRPRSPGPPRVGFLSGTTTHDEDWASVEPAVLEALDRHPEVELWLGGHLQPSDAVERLAPRLRRLPFVRWDRLPEVLRDLDVNLAPLTPGSRFNDAKSAIKWLEAALCATPTVASPSAPFREAIDHGRTGWLAEGHDGWVAGLDGLLADPDRRAAIGARAQREATLRWSPHLQAVRYVEALQAVREAAGTPRQPDPAWEPERHDEPALAAPVALTPYRLDATDPTPAPEAADRSGWAGTLRRAGGVLRREGPAATVARARRSISHRRALRRAR